MKITRIFLLFTILIITVIFSSCKKDGIDQVGDFSSIFTEKFPMHKTLNVNPENLVISWQTSKDPEGGPVTYDVYFGDVFPPPLVSRGKSDTVYLPPSPLADNTKYYWKVKAIDKDNNRMIMNIYSLNLGYACFTTRPKMIQGTFTDPRDGNTYKTITIGTKTWMAENLRYNRPTGGSYIYNNVISNEPLYGRLYDSAAVKDVSASTRIAPPGWHIPTNSEMQDFIDFFPETDSSRFNQDVFNPNGLNLQLGGYYDGSLSTLQYYFELNKECYLWSYTVSEHALSGCYYLLIMGEGGFNPGVSEDNYYSVRCVKD